MQIGPIRHKAKETSTKYFEQKVQVKHLYNTPPLTITAPETNLNISVIYQWLMDCETRNELIVNDILSTLKKNRNPLVLTERREHATKLGEMLTKLDVNALVLKGAMKAKERRYAAENLDNAQVIIATGKYLGEGFDLPKLDTLFLALPISWKGTLAQYAGRIHRQIEGKEEVTIYDYVDASLPMLQRMFKRRSKGYNAMGYEINTTAEEK